MGSGKTTIGREVAQRLSLPFIDLDREIEKSTGAKIGKIFEEKGEKFFRKIEREILIKTLKTEGDFVLATGGGAICNEPALKAVLQNSVPILLYGDIKTFFQRVKNGTERPLAKNFSQFQSLCDMRAPFYKRVPIKIHSDRSVESAASEIVRILRRKEWNDVQKIRFETGGLFELKETPKKFLITDKNVNSIYDLRADFRYIVEFSEESKNINEVIKIYDFLGKFKAERKDKLWGIGGGTTGDIAGFVSATYLRGMPLILVPTTLLSQTDSAIGGKNGVNTSFGKNLVGTVKIPDETFIDPLFIATLPQREILSGLGEVFKYALLSENGLFELLEREEINLTLLIKIIPLCIEEKLTFVKNDIFDRNGKRVFLNLGHTAGHMCEKALGYGKITHGEAVAFGTLVSSMYALRRGMLGKSDFDRIVSLYHKLGFSVSAFSKLKNIENSVLGEIVLHDKKAKNGLIDFVVPVRYNKSALLHGVSADEIVKFSKEVLSL